MKELNELIRDNEYVMSTIDRPQYITKAQTYSLTYLLRT